VAAAARGSARDVLFQLRALADNFFRLVIHLRDLTIYLYGDHLFGVVYLDATELLL
jgi:hypothetical protein